MDTEFSVKSIFVSKISKLFNDTLPIAVEKNDVCPICFEKMENNILYLNCRGLEINPGSPRGHENGHVGHYSCIMKWLMKNQSCPCCRHSFEKDYNDSLGYSDDFLFSVLISNKNFDNKILKRLISDEERARRLLIRGGIILFKKIFIRLGFLYSVEFITGLFLVEDLIKEMICFLNVRELHLRNNSARLILMLNNPDVFVKYGGIRVTVTSMKTYLERHGESIWTIVYEKLAKLIISISQNDKYVKQFIYFGGMDILTMGLSSSDKDIFESSLELKISLKKYI